MRAPFCTVCTSAASGCICQEVNGTSPHWHEGPGDELTDSSAIEWPSSEIAGADDTRAASWHSGADGLENGRVDDPHVDAHHFLSQLRPVYAFSYQRVVRSRRCRPCRDAALSRRSSRIPGVPWRCALCAWQIGRSANDHSHDVGPTYRRDG